MGPGYETVGRMWPGLIWTGNRLAENLSHDFGSFHEKRSAQREISEFADGAR